MNKFYNLSSKEKRIQFFSLFKETENADYIADLYRETRDRLLLIALKYVGPDFQLAQDVVQDVFVTLLENMAAQKGDHPPSIPRDPDPIKWLYKRTVHRSLDCLKKKKAIPESAIKSFNLIKDFDRKYLERHSSRAYFVEVFINKS